MTANTATKPPGGWVMDESHDSAGAKVLIKRAPKKRRLYF